VVNRPHLALVPTNGLGGRLRATTLRALAIVACVAVAMGLAYAAARFTSLFAVQTIEVAGGSGAIRESVREAGKPFLDTSLVALDQDELREQLTALPTVRSIHVDRAFPHTLRIVVVPERPLAIVRDGLESWLVSEQGQVIRSANPDTGRAVVWTLGDNDLEPGATVQDESVQLALAALREVPQAFPERIESARAGEDGAVTLVLGDGTELRLGEAEELDLKLVAAARVLRSMSPIERAGVGYLDVSVPDRAVSGQL
jgi:cell division protein FtsQ